MDAIVASIKAYVLVVYPNILTDLAISDDYLTYMVNNVVDRTLIYTNRDQLVTQFEEDLVDYPQDQEVNDEFWDCYSYPIPERLERTLADIVVSAVKSVKEKNTATIGAIKSISDNGQSISYSEQLASYFNSSSDADIFSGSTELLKRYIIPTIIRNESSFRF